MALRPRFIQRVIDARSSKMDDDVVQEAPIDLDHDLAEINEHIETERNIHGAVEKLENLKASMERFSEAGELPESAKFFAGVVYKDALRSGGLVVDEVSLESYAEEISLESVVDTIKRVWKTIFDFLAGLFKKITGFFTKAEAQAKTVIKEAKEIIKVVRKDNGEIVIVDDRIIEQLAKLAFVPSEGHWRVSVTPPQQLEAHIEKFKDTIELTDMVICESIWGTAEAIDGFISDQAGMTSLPRGGIAYNEDLRILSNGPLKLDDGDLYAMYQPIIGGHGIARYFEYTRNGKSLVVGKPTVKTVYVPTKIKITEVNTDDLTDQLGKVVDIFSQSTEYRNKIAAKFSNLTTFLEQYDVDRIAKIMNAKNPEDARYSAEVYRSDIVTMVSYLSSPASLAVYVATMRAIKTVSKILKDAVDAVKE